MSDIKDFDKFLILLKDATKELAKTMLKDYEKEALSDTKVFLKTSKDDIERWSKLLSEGKLTKEDYEWLISSKKDVLELELLKNTGLGAVQIDKFKNAFIHLLINTALDVFL